MARRCPPQKQSGQARRPRRLNGAVKDVTMFAAWLGASEKKVRSDVARGRLPYRKHGGRIVFLQDEIEDYLHRLPGVTVKEALQNMAARKGEETE